MIKLRPHHILCIAHYEGSGYSEGFNRKMREIVKRLEAGEAFRFVFGADDLCAACPNLKNGVCNTEEKVRGYDGVTAALLGVAAGREATKEIFGTAEDRICQAGKFDLICSDCEWSYICRKHQLQNGRLPRSASDPRS